MALTMASRARDELIRNWELALALDIRPALDTERLARAFRHVVSLHSRLRAIYEIRKGEVGVRLLPPEAFELEVEDATTLTEEQFRERLQLAADRPWTMSKGPQVTLTAYRRPRGRMALLLRMNHLMVDGWSIEIVLRDMIMFYLGAPAASAAVAGFDEFVEWERRFESTHEGRAQREFWRRKLARLGPRLKLPYDRAPTSPLISASANCDFRFSADMMDRVRALSQRTGASTYGFMLAAYQILLTHLSGESDVTVIATTARRTNPRFVNTVGLITNLVGLRGLTDVRTGFANHVARAGRTVIEAMSNQDCHISVIARDLAGDALDSASTFGTADSAFDQVGLYMMTANHSGLPDAGLRARYDPETKFRVGQFELRGIPLRRSDCTRELTLFFNEVGRELLAFISYNADIFDAATVEAFARKFARIAELGLDDPTRSVESIVKAL